MRVFCWFLGSYNQRNGKIKYQFYLICREEFSSPKNTNQRVNWFMTEKSGTRIAEFLHHRSVFLNSSGGGDRLPASNLTKRGNQRPLTAPHWEHIDRPHKDQWADGQNLDYKLQNKRSASETAGNEMRASIMYHQGKKDKGVQWRTAVLLPL